MSDIGKKSAETFLVRCAMQLFAMAGGIAIARVLGAEGKGLFTYASTVLATAVTVYAGQSSAISWQYGRQKKDASAVFRAAMQIFAVSAVPATLALAIVAALRPDQRSLYAVAAALPFALFVQITTGFFLADSDVRSVNAQQAFSTIAAALVYIPLLFFARAGLPVLLAVWAGSWIAAGIFSIWRIAPYMKQHGERGDARLVRGQLSYGAQIALNSVVSYLNFRIDIFLVLFMLGQKALGVYSIGIAIGELMFQITRPIVTAAFGRIVRENAHESAVLTAKCMRHTFALVLVTSVAVFFAGPPLVTIVYGSQFAGAGAVLRWLLPGVVAYSMMPVLAAFFSQQLGNPRIPLALSAISTVLCALITAATLRHIGIVGGAIATSVSYFVSFVLAIAYFVRVSGVPVSSIFVFTAGDLDAYRRLAAHTFTFKSAA